MHAQENAACNQMNISPLIEYSRKHFFSSLVFSLNWISLQVKLDPSLLTAVIPHSRYNQSNYNKTQVFRATRCWTQSTSVTVNGVNINPPSKKKDEEKMKFKSSVITATLSTGRKYTNKSHFFVICCLTWTFYAPSVHVALLPLFNYDNLNLVEWIIEERQDFFKLYSRGKREGVTLSAIAISSLMWKSLTAASLTTFLLFYVVQIKKKTWRDIQSH